jgi:hypothetical protein
MQEKRYSEQRVSQRNELVHSNKEIRSRKEKRYGIVLYGQGWGKRHREVDIRRNQRQGDLYPPLITPKFPKGDAKERLGIISYHGRTGGVLA